MDKERRLGFLDELNNIFSPATLNARGENAWAVAVKFLTLLQEQIPEDEERRKLMNAWMRSVKDKNYKKFSSALRRYERQRHE